VVTATAPVTYDSGTQTVAVTVGTTAGTLAAGNDARLDDPNALAVGESTLPRYAVNFLFPGAFAGSGSLRGAQFAATKTETITKVKILTSTSVAAATPTLCRIGIYQVNPATGLHTLVASTPNDTTLFATASTAYTRTLSAPLAKVAGNRYSVCVLVVSAFALPGFAGMTGSVEMATAPSLTTRLDGQTDLPASFTALGANTNLMYAIVLP